MCHFKNEKGYVFLEKRILSVFKKVAIFAVEKFADVKRFYITIKEIYFQVTKVFYFYIYDILSVQLIDMIPLYYTAL